MRIKTNESINTINNTYGRYVPLTLGENDELITNGEEDLMDDIEPMDIIDDDFEEPILDKISEPSFDFKKQMLQHIKSIISNNRFKPDRRKDYITFRVKGKKDIIDGIPTEIKGAKGNTTISFAKINQNGIISGVKIVPFKDVILENYIEKSSEYIFDLIDGSYLGGNTNICMKIFDKHDNILDHPDECVGTYDNENQLETEMKRLLKPNTKVEASTLEGDIIAKMISKEKSIYESNKQKTRFKLVKESLDEKE